MHARSARREPVSSPRRRTADDRPGTAHREVPRGRAASPCSPRSSLAVAAPADAAACSRSARTARASRRSRSGWASPSTASTAPPRKRAVKRFQRRHGLTADGIVGPATWAALKRAHARAASAHGTRGGPQGRDARAVRAAPAARARHRRRRRLRPRHPRAPSSASSARTGSPRTASSAPPRGRRSATASIRVVLKRAHLRGGSARRPPDRRAARDRRGQPHRPQAVQVRRRPRAVERLGLRLLGLGLLRAARRRPARPPAGPRAAS